MARPLRIQYPEAYYHVTCRGNEQKKIFYLDKDSSRREQPALKELSKVFEPKELIEQFIQITGERREDICRRGKNSTERAMLMDLAR
jgi:hypothetical protein